MFGKKEGLEPGLSRIGIELGMERKKWILVGKSAAVLSVVPVMIWGHAAGPDPRVTGAPGDAAMACATSGCHTGLAKGGPINAAGGSVAATFSSGTNYTPGGGPIDITITVTDPVNHHYGFQITARPESDLANGQAGSFSDGVGFAVMCDYPFYNFRATQHPASDSCPANSIVQFEEHTAPATTPWTVRWTPPATNIGNVHFYVAGNAVNFNAMADAGDHVYTNAYVLTPGGGGSTPAIASGGVVSAGAFGGFTTIAPGSWIEIYGSDLAPDTRPWAGSDFNGNNAPTSLDGVQVTVGGQSAFVDYISPGQVNAQVPSDVGTGPQTITVTTPDGTSAPYSITIKQTQPGLLAPSSFKIGSNQYAVATLPDGATYILPANAIAGLPSRPAKPGETIILYGVGFGPAQTLSTPAQPIPAGEIVQAANQITTPVQFTFGQTPASLAYQGLAPGFVGLYQFNVVVPAVANSNSVALRFTLGGTRGSQTLVTAVHN